MSRIIEFENVFIIPSHIGHGQGPELAHSHSMPITVAFDDHMVLLLFDGEKIGFYFITSQKTTNVDFIQQS